MSKRSWRQWAAGKPKREELVFTLHPREADTLSRIAKRLNVQLNGLSAIAKEQFAYAFQDEVENAESVAINETDEFRNSLSGKLYDLRDNEIASLQWQYEFSNPQDPDSTNVKLRISWDTPTGNKPFAGLQTKRMRQQHEQLYQKGIIERALYSAMQEHGTEISGLSFLPDNAKDEPPTR